MLKCNSKQVKEKINIYILEGFKDWLKDYKDFIKFDYKNLLDFTLNNKIKDLIAKVFLIEGNDCVKNLYNRFFYWCSSLPSIINCDYFYNISAVDLLGNILEQTQEERNKYTEEQAEEKITYLIYKQLQEEIIINEMNGVSYNEVFREA